VGREKSPPRSIRLGHAEAQGQPDVGEEVAADEDGGEAVQHNNNLCFESHNETIFPTLVLKPPPKLEPVVPVQVARELARLDLGEDPDEALPLRAQDVQLPRTRKPRQRQATSRVSRPGVTGYHTDGHAPSERPLRVNRGVTARCSSLEAGYEYIDTCMRDRVTSGALVK
jgi:hypothetical protein